MGIGNSSQHLVGSAGRERERDQLLQFAMILLQSHVVRAVWHTSLFDTLGKCLVAEQFWQCSF